VSFDGKFLATAGMDRRVHIWDTATRTQLVAFPGHKDIISVSVLSASHAMSARQCTRVAVAGLAPSTPGTPSPSALSAREAR